MRADVKMLKDKYRTGTRVLLHDMAGEPQMYDGLEGSVTHVDDAGQVHVRWDNGSSLALNLDCDSFEILTDETKINVLLVEPGKYPRMVEINDSLEDLQRLVGGYIEVYSPFDDEVAIVCNDEGKIDGLPLNRAVYDQETGEILDVIAGSFFLVSAPLEYDSFQSLSPDQEMKYSKMFRYPEHITMGFGKITAEKYKPASKENER